MTVALIFMRAAKARASVTITPWHDECMKAHIVHENTRLRLYVHASPHLIYLAIFFSFAFNTFLI